MAEGSKTHRGHPVRSFSVKVKQHYLLFRDGGLSHWLAFWAAVLVASRSEAS